MNKVSVKNADLGGWSFPSIHIDDVLISELLCKTTGNNLDSGLFCAWAIQEEAIFQEDKYISTLLDEKRSCNLPILLCPEDQDFSCIIVVAQVIYTENTVTWNKIGHVDIYDFNEKELEVSAIEDIENWTTDDWEQYYDTMGFESVIEEDYKKYMATNWKHYNLRRNWNYYHIKFNNDKYIKWSTLPSFTFDTKEYEDVVSYFRENHRHF